MSTSPGTTSGELTYVATLLHQLVASGAIPLNEWEALTAADRELLAKLPDSASLSHELVVRRLLTTFQASRVRAGIVTGLVLGNYRLLEKIGSGGMGIVFRAEHRRLRVPVAVKALFVDGQKNRAAVERFFQEVRAVTGLRHPRIVAAIDAGEEPNAGPDGEAVPYLVMEYVSGRNLDDVVAQDGALPVAVACQLGHQVADALTEAHRNGLVHRDIKPSNILVTPDGQAKLLDFGVARLPGRTDRITVEGSRLGTLAFMAPEQAINPHDVDPRADVFSLGATIYFMLTAKDPFPTPGGATSALQSPDVRAVRPEVPVPVAEMLKRMMALDPEHRTPSATAAMQELTPFLGWRPAGPSVPVQMDLPPIPSASTGGTIAADAGSSTTPLHRVLIVDDEEPVRRVCRLALSAERLVCEEVTNGPDAIKRALNEPFDLILLDVDLPGCTGDEVLKQLRERPPAPNIKVLMLSGRAPGDELARMLLSGADDYLTKPFSIVQLRSRVKAAIRLKNAQDRSDRLTNQLAESNSELERALTARDSELIQARGALVLALAKLVGERSTETGPHLIRLQRYSRVLAGAAANTPSFANRITPEFVQAVEAAAPLHDIGKVAVPDNILNKPGPLTTEERLVMQKHTTVGADTLAGVTAQYSFASGFFQIAVDIARHHHERWDGTGYPDRIAGEAIPLSARIVAIGDVYDALRARRVYKGAITHEEAVIQMVEKSPGHFDPALLMVFQSVATQFDRVFVEMTD